MSKKEEAILQQQQQQQQGGGLKDGGGEEYLEDEAGDDPFFESLDRVPSGVSFDFDVPTSGSGSGSDSDEEDDVRISFASAMAPPSFRRISLADFDEFDDNADNNNNDLAGTGGGGGGGDYDYGMWMAEPMSIKERRRRLLQGMGLTSGKDLAARSRRMSHLNPAAASSRSLRLASHRFAAAAAADAPVVAPSPAPKQPPPPPSSPPVTGIARSRSDSQLAGERRGPAGALFRCSSSSTEWMKVRHHGKSHKELTGLYMCQDIQAHQGSIWSIKFSSDSLYLASAGEDRVVHVWQVIERDSLHRRDANSSTTNGSAPSATQHSSKRTKKGKASSGSTRSSVPDYIVMPETVFSLSDKPVCSFHGHLDDVLDLSWSKSQHLLSSSMDKTVRLWDMETKACLKLFAHNDYVTCIQFNPVDDRYFISGSLDAKVRIWSIPDRQVVDWSELHEMVTATCYTPDGQGALVGSHKGSCRFYNTSDCKLYQEGQMDIRSKKKKSHAKKITGFQFAPDNPSEVMITSADSQIRVFDGVDMIHKFRGFRNTSSQISASFSLDGKYVVCASEDSHVYIWKRGAVRNASAGGRSKGWVTTRSHEHFYCKDVSVAIPWPSSGSNCEPPCLPSWSKRHNDSQHLSFSDSQRSTMSTLEDIFPSSRSDCPAPLPKVPLENALPCTEDLCLASLSGPSLGSSSSFLSASASLQSATVASGASSLSSWRWGYGGSSRMSTSNLEASNAWGLVVVTAGLGGNIRIYQNFGLPLGLNRQTNLF